MAGPLSGIRVIEIGQAYAGPLAGAILGDLGADVIKVEKPEGGDDARLWGPPFVDGTSVFFRANNRNKRSVTIDIKSPDGVARLKALAATADILIQNLRPGIAEELGIGAAALRAGNPRLIYCSIWAFGARGELRGAPGFDPLMQAFAAVMTLTGRPDDPPTFCAPAINDKATGLWCVIGALAALQQRHATGQGCVIDTSLFESAVAWVGNAMADYRATGEIPARSTGASTKIVPYQVFETADRPLCIAAGNDRLFAKCAGVLGHPEWAADARFASGPQRILHRASLVAAMQDVLAAAPRAHWIERLARAGVPCAPVNDLAELSESDQLAAVDLMRVLPDSLMQIVGLPISFDGARPHPTRDAPQLGQHNAEVFGAEPFGREPGAADDDRFPTAS